MAINALSFLLKREQCHYVSALKKKKAKIIILFVITQQRDFQVPFSQTCCKHYGHKQKAVSHLLICPWPNSRNVTFSQRETKLNQYRWHFPQGDFSIHACFIACQAPLLFRSDPSSEPIPYQAPCSATLNPLSSPIQEGSLEHSIT